MGRESRELIAGVWWISGARGCNVYLLDVRGVTVLVDTGLPGSASRVAREVERVGLGRPPLLLLTHAHPDHAGGAAALRRYFGCRVALGEGDTERSQGVTRARTTRLQRPQPGWLKRALRLLAPASEMRAAVEVDLPLTGESEVTPGLIAVPVPGHTVGSYCYVDIDRGVALVGDLVLSFPDGLARPLAAISDDDRAYVASLRAFAARAPSKGLAGHGAPVLTDFDGALRGLAEQPRSVAPTPRRLLRRLRRIAWFAYHYWSTAG